MGHLRIGQGTDAPHDLFGMAERIDHEMQNIRFSSVQVAAAERLFYMREPTDDTSAPFDGLRWRILNEPVDWPRNVRASVLPEEFDSPIALSDRHRTICCGLAPAGRLRFNHLIHLVRGLLGQALGMFVHISGAV
jgi:hypothetical protein